MSLDAARVSELASDAGSRKAGEALAQAGLWQALGATDDGVIWGEIKGSGTLPYRTSANDDGSATKCSCPSRKFPCKHALGLMLIAANTPLALPRAQAPDWVTSWARGRAGRVSPQTPAKPIDEAAQARRRAARESRVEAGLDELELWLRDLLQRGLAAARADPYTVFDRMAARLVDAQAAGLARRVRALPALLAGTSSRGHDHAGMAIGRLFLLIRAARRIDRLDPHVQAGLRAAIGFPVTVDQLAAEPDVTDSWSVLAHRIDIADGLTARAVWLAGHATGRIAQILDFAAGAAPLPLAPAPGQCLQGAIVFYPDAPALRAVTRDTRITTPQHATIPGAGSINAALTNVAKALGAAPWLDRFPLRLAAVRFGTLGASGGTIGVGDAGGTLPLAQSARLAPFLAVAGGRAVDLFGLWDGCVLDPLAIVTEGRHYVVPASDERPLLRRVA